MNDNIYWIWFSKLAINRKTKLELLEKFKQPKIIYNLDEIKLNYVINDSSEKYKIIKEIINPGNKNNLNRINNYLQKKNIQVIDYYNEKYPKRLKQIYDPPVLLYAIGNTELLNMESIAIVGTRNCTKYGEIVTKKISYSLSNRFTIISGLAKRN